MAIGSSQDTYKTIQMQYGRLQRKLCPKERSRSSYRGTAWLNSMALKRTLLIEHEELQSHYRYAETPKGGFGPIGSLGHHLWINAPLVYKEHCQPPFSIE
ncbi:Transcription factor RLM1 [Fusarium oxysporum f. sp. albedinis]|nr:Transcription factor RLM1 [Fusarium oxysporum f. sp. albedinis]